MTLTEVVVSAAILGISTQVGLQGWASTAKASASAVLIDQQHQRLEQRLLASRRLLQASDLVDVACRFDADALDGILAALPADPLFSLFVAAYQAPLYLTPMVAGWFADRSRHS